MPVSKSDQNAPKRILLIRPSALGDVCRSVPVLVSLKRAYPQAKIDWLVNDSFVDAISAHPDLHAVVPFPRRRFARWWRSPVVAGELIRYFSALRAERYDLVLDCQGLGRSGLLAWMTRASRRIGDRHAREGGWLGTNHRIDTSMHPHDVDRMLALLEACDVPVVKDMQLHVPESDRDAWAARDEFSGARYAVLAPTSRWSSKAWPVDRWSALAAALLERGCDHVFVVGAPDEREVTNAVCTGVGDSRVHDFAGRTTIGGLLAIIERASLTVSNDSAALHMAVGFGGRCVGLYGPTDPGKVGPYELDACVVRAPLDRAVSYRDQSLGDSIMRGIPLEAVLERADAVLAGVPA